MASNRATIQKVADGTQSLRGLYPQFNSAKSFLDSIDSDESHDREFSVLSERQFEFDDVVTNAQAYRRVLVAATHTLRTNSREHAASDDTRAGTTINSGPSGQHNGSPQSANQSRKMNANLPSSSGGLMSQSTGSSSSDALLGKPSSQSSTFGDSNSFAQQFRGYLDNVEGELRNSAEEAARLKALLQEKDAIVENLQKEIVENQYRRAIAEDRLRKSEAEEASLQATVGALATEIKELGHRLAMAKHELNISEEKYYEELHAAKIRYKQLHMKHRDDLSRVTRRLVESETEKDNLKKTLQSREKSLVDVLHTLSLHTADLTTKECQIQTLEIDLILLRQYGRNFVDSVRSSRAAQLGNIMLVPMQSPGWLDESLKGPPQFQVIFAPTSPDGPPAEWDGIAPTNPDGSPAKWNSEFPQPCSRKNLSSNQGEESKWIFANESGKIEELDAAPIVPVLAPGPNPEMTKTGESKKEKLEDLGNLPTRTHLPWIQKKEPPKPGKIRGRYRSPK